MYKEAGSEFVQSCFLLVFLETSLSFMSASMVWGYGIPFYLVCFCIASMHFHFNLCIEIDSTKLQVRLFEKNKKKTTAANQTEPLSFPTQSRHSCQSKSHGFVVLRGEYPWISLLMQL